MDSYQFFGACEILDFHGDFHAKFLLNSTNNFVRFWPTKNSGVRPFRHRDVGFDQQPMTGVLFIFPFRKSGGSSGSPSPYMIVVALS